MLIDAKRVTAIHINTNRSEHTSHVEGLNMIVKGLYEGIILMEMERFCR